MHLLLMSRSLSNIIERHSAQVTARVRSLVGVMHHDMSPETGRVNESLAASLALVWIILLAPVHMNTMLEHEVPGGKDLDTVLARGAVPMLLLHVRLVPAKTRDSSVANLAEKLTVVLLVTHHVGQVVRCLAWKEK